MSSNIICNKNIYTMIKLWVITSITCILINTASYVQPAIHAISVPTAADFAYDKPTESMICNGTAKHANIHTVDGITGMGNITIKYATQSTCKSEFTSISTIAPSQAGIYRIYIDVSEGTKYTSITMLTSDEWTFVILPTPERKTLTIPICGHHDFLPSPKLILPSPDDVFIGIPVGDGIFTHDNTGNVFCFYTGQQIIPSISVAVNTNVTGINKFVCLAAHEYTITWPDELITAGEKSICITLRGSYCGTFQIDSLFTIKPNIF